MASGDLPLVLLVAVLFLLSILLAVAETALTRITLPKAQALAETRGRSGERLLRLVEHHEWLNPLLLVVLASQSVQSLVLGSIVEDGPGLLLVGILNITVFFVFAEVGPKTWAILHTERAALIAARNAPEHADEQHDGSTEDELAQLVVHGILHVLGHDHADEAEKTAMQAKEQELLDRYHRGDR